MNAMNLREFQFHVLHVNAKTNWSFVQVTTAEGFHGVGEASLNGWEDLLRPYASLFRQSIVGKTFATRAELVAACQTFPHTFGGVVSHAIKSATEQALTDAWAKTQGLSTWQMLDRARVREAVTVYANINRATNPRTPQGFATSARAAIAQGFRAVKLAPFDGVFPEQCGAQSGQIQAGIERVLAVRDAVGADVRVMVDCHWRFNETVALEVLRALRPANLYWFECPVTESDHEAIARLRRAANAQATRLAGAEMLTEVSGFTPIFKQGLYDVVMPDVKYCGGLDALLRIADAGARAGVKVAPHNPTGPICNVASVHASVVHEAMDFLEVQVGESPLFLDCVGGAHPIIANGTFAPLPAPGFGMQLSPAVFAAHPFAPVPFGLDERLG
jgi:galactonate dehydratase